MRNPGSTKKRRDLTSKHLIMAQSPVCCVPTIQTHTACIWASFNNLWILQGGMLFHLIREINKTHYGSESILGNVAKIVHTLPVWGLLPSDLGHVIFLAGKSFPLLFTCQTLICPSRLNSKLTLTGRPSQTSLRQLGNSTRLWGPPLEPHHALVIRPCPLGPCLIHKRIGNGLMNEWGDELTNMDIPSSFIQDMVSPPLHDQFPPNMS